MALLANDSDTRIPSWANRAAKSATIRKAEEELERRVSSYIGKMSILWLNVSDEASAMSDRAYLERNLIGLIAGRGKPLDPPTKKWLGLSSPEARIRSSGLWNLNHLTHVYDPQFLGVLAQYVRITTNRNDPPSRSLAPPGWCEHE